MTDLQTPSGTETAEKKKAREEYKTKVESILYNVVSKNGKREEAYVTIYEGKIMAYGSKRRINKAMVVAAGLTTAAATVTRYKTEWLKN